jgi:molybdopterin-binding protein
MPLDGRADLLFHLGPLSSGHHPREECRTMKISARNTLKGKVKQIEQGAVNTEVTIELPGGMEIVSIITKKSAATLGLAKGKDVYAVIKASSVMIGVDH